jgi:hypothetical protein
VSGVHVCTHDGHSRHSESTQYEAAAERSGTHMIQANSQHPTYVKDEGENNREAESECTKNDGGTCQNNKWQRSYADRQLG